MEKALTILCVNGQPQIPTLITALSLSYIYNLAEGVVGWSEDVMYLASPGRPTDIGFQLGKACYPCST